MIFGDGAIYQQGKQTLRLLFIEESAEKSLHKQGNDVIVSLPTVEVVQVFALLYCLSLLTISWAA